ncbi:MAG TPA: alpha-hydroxy acid oxidase [Amycolatopsis sp.]|jgi:L-lactate dehydrogenase (cytochrome)|nr:alpha-hydroxy acid oxidase [Amycolatopsis sp.]
MKQKPISRRQFPRVAELRPLLRPKLPRLTGVEDRLAAAANVDDVKQLARRRAPRAVFDYVEGGAANEVSIGRSAEAFSRAEFEPRVLRDVSAVETGTSILGREASMPVVLAPTGFTRMMHRDGESGVTRAAAEAGVPYALSTMGTTSIEELAAVSPATRRWFQLYLWQDRPRSMDLLRRAADSGYEALILTVDTPVAGPRLRDVRNGMTIPPALTGKTLVNGALHPRWWFDFLTSPPLEFASVTEWAGTPAELSDTLLDPSVTIDDVHWLRKNWPGKLIVKGILGVADAEAIVDAGADAIVVSNHGGRQLDRSPVPLERLPAIAEALAGRAEIYVDGGVTNGADVAAAVCLGAQAVLVGRAYLYGVMAGGEHGVRRVTGILRKELETTMRLLGCASVKELSADRIRLRAV